MSIVAGLGYFDGLNTYSGYLVPNLLDPTGHKVGTCDAGWTYTQVNQDKPNGCGEAGWKGKLVPDNPLGFNFSGPCDGHDKGYGKCGKSKDETDSEFLTAMYAVCDSEGSESQTRLDEAWGGVQEPSLAWKLTNRLKQTARGGGAQVRVEACKKVAWLYYEAVKKFGEDPHTAAQKANCNCQITETTKHCDGTSTSSTRQKEASF